MALTGLDLVVEVTSFICPTPEYWDKGMCRWVWAPISFSRVLHPNSSPLLHSSQHLPFFQIHLLLFHFPPKDVNQTGIMSYSREQAQPRARL